MCSPLGLVPKHDGGWRRIHDLSFPYGLSVNDGIPLEWGALEYATFDDVVAALLQQGRGAILVKRNLKDAFRHIPVAVSDRATIPIGWNDSYHSAYGHRLSYSIYSPKRSIGSWWRSSTGQSCSTTSTIFFAILSPWADGVAYGQAFDQICNDLGLIVNHTKDIMGTIADFSGN